MMCHSAVLSPRPAKVQVLPADRTLEERPVWKSIDGTWKPLHGNFFANGCSMEWHDFHIAADLDWSRSFHSGSLEICLNYSGRAQLDQAATLGPGQMAIYTAGPGATRLAGSMHRFFTIELSPNYFRTHLAAFIDHLLPQVRDFASGRTSNWFEVRPLPGNFSQMRAPLLSPPVAAGAVDLWYQSKIREIVAQTLFTEDKPQELFCEKQQRLNRERVERVIFLLERDFENPPSLEMLSKEVGCSPFYLSRLFVKETDVSIPKFLRRKRIERAAELLKSAKMNVTEAAIAVGYASLSAFNKAFVEQIGCCPGLYAYLKPEVILRNAKARQFRA